MDYTELPRQLIYKDRLWLEDFDIYNNGKNFNKPVVQVLKKEFSHKRDVEKYILYSMNNAYYICTMALMEKDPSLRVTKYCDLAGVVNGKVLNGLHQSVLSLVFYYLCSLPKGVGHHLEEMLLELKTYISEYIIKNLPDVVLPSNEFAPRVIDDSAVRDAQISEYRWMTQTDYFHEEHLKRIVESLGKAPEEKQCVIKILVDAVEMSYSGNSRYKESRLQLLQNMAKEYGGDKEDEPATNQSNANQPEIDIAPLKKRNEELEEENERLKKQLAQQPAVVDDNEKEELCAEIENLKAEIEYLKNNDSHLSAKQAAILTITACYHAGKWKNRENLHPILTNLFGIPETHAKRRLREGIKEKEVEELAQCFDDVSPMIARLIREMPEKLKSNK